MSLDDIDWATITQAQAKRLEHVATRRRMAMSEKYNRGEVSDAEFDAINWIEDALAVFAGCGAKPDRYCARCGAYVADCRSRQCAGSGREPFILRKPKVDSEMGIVK